MLRESPGRLTQMESPSLSEATAPSRSVGRSSAQDCHTLCLLVGCEQDYGFVGDLEQMADMWKTVKIAGLHAKAKNLCVSQMYWTFHIGMKGVSICKPQGKLTPLLLMATVPKQEVLIPFTALK
jgi:hypothetical protein